MHGDGGVAARGGDVAAAAEGQGGAALQGVLPVAQQKHSALRALLCQVCGGPADRDP